VNVLADGVSRAMDEIGSVTGFIYEGTNLTVDLAARNRPPRRNAF